MWAVCVEVSGVCCIELAWAATVRQNHAHSTADHCGAAGLLLHIDNQRGEEGAAAGKGGGQVHIGSMWRCLGCAASSLRGQQVLDRTMRIALLVTVGLPDLLHIGNQSRPHILIWG